MDTPKIAVIGDVILDKYSYGSVTRISPEAPIPIVSVNQELYKPGGAGNVAANLATLGARVDLFGIVGEDHYRPLFLEAVGMFGIRCKLVADKARQTIVKQRVISASQQILRVDYETTGELEPSQLETLLERFDAPYDAIIVSDYGKGVVSSSLMEFLRSQSVPILVDPKPSNVHLYHDVQLLKPNAVDCMEMAGTSDDVEGAHSLLKRLNSPVLLTRGGKGMAFIDKDPAHSLAVPTMAKDVIDVTGAGDTVIATYAFYVSSGVAQHEAIKIANAAAGIAVTKVGCYQVTPEDLKEYVS